MWDKIVKLFAKVQEFLSADYIFGVSIGQLIFSFVLIFAAIVIRFIVCSIVYNRLASWIESRLDALEAKTLEKIKKPLGYIIVLFGVYLGVKVLNIYSNESVRNFVDSFFFTCIWLCVAWFSICFVDVLSLYLKHRASKTSSRLDDMLIPLISKSLKIFIWIIALVSVVHNMGYSISGLVAGLGIGGLAMAMAAKDTLANIFGSITIFLDNPFQIGDWIQIDDAEGVVESIGFRSTRIRTFYKTQVSIPNNSIANKVVNNYSRMQRRRISTTLNLTYETTPEEIEQAIVAVKDVLKRTKGVAQDFYIVNFTGFGSCSLDIMLYYFTETTDWREYLDIREKVNLEIMKEFQKLGVEFAFPSTSVYFRAGEKGQVPRIELK